MSLITQIKAAAVAGAFMLTFVGLWEVEQTCRPGAAALAERRSKSQEKNSFIQFDLPEIGGSRMRGNSATAAIETYGSRNIVGAVR